MQNSATIGFIGAGNMAYALVNGLIDGGFNKNNIKISDSNEKLLSQRKDEFNLEVFTDNTELAARCDVVVLAIKPQIMSQVCKELAGALDHQPLIISIAAGVRSNDIARWLGADYAIVRSMPNTPALLGQGASGLYANSTASTQEKSLAEDILSAVGHCLWVDNEKMLDAVTALSGSGPAYFFLMIESMTKAAVDLGLDEDSAQKLSIQTALGAATMAKLSEDAPHELRTKVTSAGGTTQAAIESFLEQNFEAVVSHAMRAAFNRAREMSSEFGDDE